MDRAYAPKFACLEVLLYSDLPFLGGCPRSNPYAYLNGEYCCKTDEENPDGGLQDEIDSGTCDGVNFNEQSTCCKDAEFVKCPEANGCSALTGAN